MRWSNFTVVGENIHCTRVVKKGGKRSLTAADGREAVSFTFQGEDRCLALPTDWETISPAYARGSIKHAALAIWQAMNGQGADQADGRDYLCWMAERQIHAGATYLDVNVDELSTDASVCREAIAFVVDFLGRRYDTPLSIDSSDVNVLAAGLSGCRRDIGRPMINSVSLEREDAVDLIGDYQAVAIVSAAGRDGMPADAESKMVNLRKIIGILDGKGVPRDSMFLDPLVLPVSTDPMNAANFLTAVSSASNEFEGVHICGGFSNISFGMPQRKLLNMVFTWLCVEAGADGGIIDPVSMPVDKLETLDPEAEDFRLAAAVLKGEDMFGMEYISASRDGRI